MKYKKKIEPLYLSNMFNPLRHILSVAYVLIGNQNHAQTKAIVALFVILAVVGANRSGPAVVLTEKSPSSAACVFSSRHPPTAEAVVLNIFSYLIINYR